MNKRWQEWDRKWEQLSARERVLLLLVAAVLPLVLIFVLLIEPALKSLQKIPADITTLESSVASQQKLLKMLKSQEAKDPNIKARQQLKALRQRLLEDKVAIKKAATQLVEPEEMLTLLRSVLTTEAGIQVLSVRSLPVQERQLGQPQQADGTTAKTKNTIKEKTTEKAVEVDSAILYLHPVELELEGSYQGLYNYLLKLEQLEQAFFWDLLEYNVVQFPKAKIKLQVHTLSSSAGWLGA